MLLFEQQLPALLFGHVPLPGENRILLSLVKGSLRPQNVQQQQCCSFSVHGSVAGTRGAVTPLWRGRALLLGTVGVGSTLSDPLSACGGGSSRAGKILPLCSHRVVRAAATETCFCLWRVFPGRSRRCGESSSVGRSCQSLHKGEPEQGAGLAGQETVRIKHPAKRVNFCVF